MNLHMPKIPIYQIISVTFIIVFFLLIFLRPSTSKSKSFSFDFTLPKSNTLDAIIQEQLSGIEGKYAVYIENLQTQEKYVFNDQEVFPAASLYKLFLTSAAVQNIQDRTLTQDTIVNSTKSHLEQVYDDVDFGYEDTDEKISYSVDEILQRIGRISDNFASIMLAEKIGWDSVQAQSDTIGSKNTVIKNPITTTAADIGNFFSKLYRNQIISPDSSEQIKDYLRLNQINDRIPFKIPEDIKIIHKTGELSRIRHDAGIVYARTPFVIVIMSKDVPFEDEANEVIADLSYNIFKYFDESGR